MADGIETVDIADSLVEYGPSTVDLNTNIVTYSFVRFDKRGREMDMTILRSAQPQFEAMLGAPNARFVYLAGRNPDNKKFERIMTAFSTGDRAYKVDMLDERLHGDRADAMKKASFLVAAFKAVGIGILVLGVLLLIFVPIAALGMLGFGGWLLYKGLQYSKLVKGMVQQHQAVMAQFSGAESL